jgi:glycosyltransferase XagB
MACWVFGGLGLMYLAVAIARVTGKAHLVLSGLILPLYWVMMSLAAIKALVQLAFQPSLWEKTTHGLNRVAS